MIFGQDLEPSQPVRLAEVMKLLLEVEVCKISIHIRPEHISNQNFLLQAENLKNGKLHSSETLIF